MPTVFALIPDNAHFLDAQGNPANGAKLFVYTAGSSTKATTYTESDGAVANSNPIVLDSRGEMPNGCYVASGTYKTVLAPATDTDPPAAPYRTRDNLSPVNDTSTTVDQFAASGLTPTFVSATQFTLAGDQRTEFHVGRRLKTSNSGGTGYHTITGSSFSSSTTVTVVNDSVVLDSGLASVSLSILRADSQSAIPGVTVDEDDWTFSGTVTVGGNAVASTVTTTRGDIIRRGASADERLPLGANGEFLTSDGTDALWTGNPSLRVLITSGTFSSDDDLEVSLASTYKRYEIQIEDFRATTNAGTLVATVSDGTYKTSGYMYSLMRVNGGSVSGLASGSSSSIQLTDTSVGNAAADTLQGLVSVFGHQQAGQQAEVQWQVGGNDNTTQYSMQGQGRYATDGAITAMKLAMSAGAGEMASGRYYVWGIK